ncbi:hypothetical protein ACHAWC_005755 [Mediolabrus comicus]
MSCTIIVTLLLLLLLLPNAAVCKADNHNTGRRSGGDDNDNAQQNTPPTTKLLVKYKPGADNNDNNINLRTASGNNDNDDLHYQQLRLSSSVNNNKVRSITNISKKGHLALVDVNTENKEAVMDELMMNDNVLLVEEDFEIRKSPAIDEEASSSSSSSSNHNLRRSLEEQHQYGNKLIQAEEIWKLVSSEPNRYINRPVKVCIIDTGYNIDHEDLPKDNNMVTQTDVGYGSSFIDNDGHGTHCAGVIGAIGFNNVGIVGVNPDPTKISFHIIKALNDDGVGTASAVLRAIQGCIDGGSKIISMSIGGGPNSEIFRAEYERAYDEDILLVSASGNQGLPIHDYPASYAPVISVGAVDQFGNRADFSNYSDQLELMAPGYQIKSTYTNGQYRTLSGTSMATPFVAGAFALVWGYFPQCSNHQMRNVFARTARKISQDPSGCDEKNGFGIIQAKDAFDALALYGCDFGGEDSIPKSLGAVGGCEQTRSLTAKTTPPTPTQNPTVKFVLPPPVLEFLDSPKPQPPTSPPLTITLPFITFQPTISPISSKPTVSPSRSPTSKPSGSPTNPPTSKPTTLTPTPAPTNAVSLVFITSPPPSYSPTNKPSSSEPTNVPTQNLTSPPTRLPTLKPSSTVPSALPTTGSPPTSEPPFPWASPSSLPTSNPTSKPTAEPSLPPTLNPTSAPSFSPSDAITSNPSIRPSKSPSLDPTPLPSKNPTLHPTPMQQMTESRSDGWITKIAEEFNDKYGVFASGGNSVRWTGDRFGRSGLVMINSGDGNSMKSSLVSEKILFDMPYTECKITISFYSNGHMGEGDGFCLDYASNLASGWNTIQCWRTGQDVVPKQWYDQEQIDFVVDSDDTIDFIRIRFRSDSDESLDRVFLDKVDVQMRL